MAQLSNPINDVQKEAANYKAGYEHIPPGWYKAVIIDDRLESYGAGEETLIMRFELQDGTKRNVNGLITIQNPDDWKVKKGRATLSHIGDCIGHTGQIIRTDVLFGRPLEVRIADKPYKHKETGEDMPGSTIKDYRKVGASPATPASDNGGTTKRPSW